VVVVVVTIGVCIGSGSVLNWDGWIGMGLVDGGFCFGFLDEDFGLGVGLYSGVISIVGGMSLGISGGCVSV
jgi:hypothetical protein